MRTADAAARHRLMCLSRFSSPGAIALLAAPGVCVRQTLPPAIG
ncbi:MULTISPECIES: hypothetical protein [unclassified Clostridium]|nr:MULTISPECIES: hypothetical protein [unclassified Clostridium]